MYWQGPDLSSTQVIHDLELLQPVMNAVGELGFTLLKIEGELPD
jgi:hypothetical protein